MLSPADAALAARDPAIPGLGMLLDPAAFAMALRLALPGAMIGPVEARYIRYKPATSCLVAYSVDVEGAPATLYARAYARSQGAKLERARRLREAGGALGVGGLTFDEALVAVYSWPHDRELPALARLTDRDERARLLAELCPARPDLRGARLLDLRHRPERRYVGRLAGAAGGDALLKLYCADDYERARDAAAAFQTRGPLQVAAPLGRSDEWRALLFPWQAGRPLADTLWDDPAGVRLAGAALAELHGQLGAGLPRHHVDAPCAELEAAARAVAVICPELAARLAGLVEQLAAQIKASGEPPRPLHGDFYADQVLIGAGRATLLDLDNARWGEPAADLGNFVAHLLRAAALGRGSASQVAPLAAALLDGYAERAPRPPRARIALYSAAGLLRLAPEPFRYRATDWPAQTYALVGLAEGCLAKARPGAGQTVAQERLHV